MNKQHFLNPFEIKALMNELKDYNIVNIFPLVESLDIIYYHIFFIYEGLILDLEVSHSTSKSSITSDLCDFVLVCKSQLHKKTLIYKDYLNSNKHSDPSILDSIKAELISELNYQPLLFMEIGFIDNPMPDILVKSFSFDLEHYISTGMNPKKSLEYIFSKYSLVNDRVLELIKNTKGFM